MTDRPMRVSGGVAITPMTTVATAIRIKVDRDRLWDALSALVEDAHRHGHADPFILANAETILEETNQP